jgi:hypothetical protein
MKGKKMRHKLKDFFTTESSGCQWADNRRDCADIRSFFGVCLIPEEIMFPSIIMLFDNQSPFEWKRSTTPLSQSSDLCVLLIESKNFGQIRRFFFPLFRSFLLSVLWEWFFFALMIHRFIYFLYLLAGFVWAFFLGFYYYYYYL